MTPLPSLKPHVIVLTAFAFILLIEAIGTVAYMHLEGWSFIDSFYFTAITLTTIGFGDMVPSHAISKLFTVLFAFTGVGAVLFFITLISKFYFQHKMLQVAHLEHKIHNLMTPKGIKQAEEQVEKKAEKVEAKEEKLEKEEKQIKKEEKQVKQASKQIETNKTRLKKIAKKIK